MLLPALNIAKQKAQAISCAGNLRQIGLALHGYAGDHHGWIQTDGAVNWHYALCNNGYSKYPPYPDTQMDKKLKPFYCPTGKPAAIATNVYGISYWSVGSHVRTVRAPAADGKYYSNIYDSSNGKSAGLSTSELILMGDSVTTGGAQTWFINTFSATIPPLHVYMLSIRHSKAANSLFIDGHVGQVRAMDASKLKIYSVGLPDGTRIIPY